MTTHVSAASGRGITPRSAAAGMRGQTPVGSFPGEPTEAAAARTRIAALPARPVRRARGLRRTILVGVVGLISFGLVSAAASSLLVTQTPTPAQGSATVSGACVSSASIAYVLVDSNGSTVTAASGNAVRVSQVVVTKTAGSTACTASDQGAIKFSGTSVWDGTNPTYSGTGWTFTLTNVSANQLANWNPGTITVTVFQ